MKPVPQHGFTKPTADPPQPLSPPPPWPRCPCPPQRVVSVSIAGVQHPPPTHTHTPPPRLAVLLHEVGTSPTCKPPVPPAATPRRNPVPPPHHLIALPFAALLNPPCQGVQLLDHQPAHAVHLPPQCRCTKLHPPSLPSPPHRLCICHAAHAHSNESTPSLVPPPPAPQCRFKKVLQAESVSDVCGVMQWPLCLYHLQLQLQYLARQSRATHKGARVIVGHVSVSLESCVA